MVALRRRNPCAENLFKQISGFHVLAACPGRCLPDFADRFACAGKNRLRTVENALAASADRSIFSLCRD
jgi:hypothetical protein